MPKGPRLSFNPEAGMDRAFARGGFAPRAASLTALLIASTALTAIAFVPSAHAGTPQWLGTASSNWFTQGNWSPAGVPNAADNVTVDTTSPHATVINGGTAAGAQVIVGNAGNGNLAITNGGGLTTSGFGYLGFSANSTGTVSVDGTGSLWTSSSGLVVGSSGSGTLTITNGGAVSSFSGLIGSFAGGTGTVTVSGSGSTWAVGTSLWVGNSGTGTLLLSQGGVAQADTFFLGANAGSHGTVTVDGVGSILSANSNVMVGDSGDGKLTVSGGGQVHSTNVVVGNVSGSQGTALVTGAGSSLFATNSLAVGATGTGSLTVTNGGVVSANHGLLGANAGSSGTATVDDNRLRGWFDRRADGDDPVAVHDHGLVVEHAFAIHRHDVDVHERDAPRCRR